MNRLFLALKADIYDYDKLKSDFAPCIGGRWVEDENLHVTLCYFGNLYTADEIIARLPSEIKRGTPLELSALGYFSHNNILYAKPQEHGLELLHALVCSPFSLKEAAPFIPHVTLMRVKKTADAKRFGETLKSYKGKSIGIVEPTLRLMQSQSTPQGVKYVCIKEF